MLRATQFYISCDANISAPNTVAFKGLSLSNPPDSGEICLYQQNILDLFFVTAAVYYFGSYILIRAIVPHCLSVNVFYACVR